MKKVFRILSICLVVFMLSTNMAAASDDGIMPLSDSRIIKVNTTISNPSSKKIKVNFSLTCYGNMKSLGASRIRFFKKNSDGSYTGVKTFWKQDHPSMYTSDDSFYASSVTYSASSSGTYYAKVTFYATDSSGVSSVVLDTKTKTV